MMVDFASKTGDIEAVPETGIAPVSLKHIAREAAHAAEREVILQVLERTEWNRVRAARLLEISYRALLYKIKNFGLRPTRRPVPRHDRFGPLDWA
jgi:two-component system, NtrC family, response regulator AtoC